MQPTDAYDRLVHSLRRHADLRAALHLLEWDEETCLPPGALDSRARQIGTLAAFLHEQETAPAFLDLVADLATRLDTLAPEQAVDVREVDWHLARRRHLDAALVRERARLHAEARGVWAEARRIDAFRTLAPYLERIVDIERQVAAAIAADRDPYEVLLEEYEPGVSLAQLAALLERVRAGSRPLLERLRARLDARALPADALCGDFPIGTQRRFNRWLAERLGFDFGRGRLDEAAHPFTTRIGSDVRLTTRYDRHDLRYALYSTLHETGHGLYEQGLDPAAWGTPRGEACSLGVHESQSRFWENVIGRCAGFWRAALPAAQAHFPALGATSLPAVLLSANAARPSLIRTEADEITYNLHIAVRFELERALIDGQLAVGALPEAWGEKMQAYLGVRPPSDRDGVLQDVHWAAGDFGYFPTYTLGNIYAGQLAQAAQRDLGTLDELLAAGDFPLLLRWLREHIHRHGQTYRAPELIRRATGAAPSPEPLLAHLERKLAFLEAA